MAVNLDQPNVLIVEGKEEVFFFKALINHLQLQDIQLIDIGGKTNFRHQLNALVHSSRFPNVVSLGIVRDAADDPNAAFRSICDALQTLDLPTPKSPLLPTTGDRPRVNVMILPEADVPGMLEDLCLKAVERDRAIPCVEQYFQCLLQQGLNKPRNASKAKVQVFLASKPEAGKRLGEAAQAGYWPCENKAFDQVKEFLQQIIS